MSARPDTRLFARPIVRLWAAAGSAATALQLWFTGAAEPTPSPRPERTRGKRTGS